MNNYLIIGCIVLGCTLAAITLYFTLPDKSPCPITCSSDEECGGVIITTTFCKDRNIYGSGQQNTCVNGSTCNATCQTTYGDVLVKTCKRDCNAGKCL